MNSIKNNLIEFALEARKNSHTPYSKKQIGSAVLFSNGEIFTGCNIENASYGGTVCAERVAIWNGLSQTKEKIKIVSIAVASDEKSPWPPCGLCRQVIAEFSNAKTEVILVNTKKKSKKILFTKLFPFAFEPGHLLK